MNLFAWIEFWKAARPGGYIEELSIRQAMRALIGQAEEYMEPLGRSIRKRLPWWFCRGRRCPAMVWCNPYAARLTA
nr:hypothetical protein [uncultured Oscillibacter sp.]